MQEHETERNKGHDHLRFLLVCIHVAVLQRFPNRKRKVAIMQTKSFQKFEKFTRQVPKVIGEVSISITKRKIGHKLGIIWLWKAFLFNKKENSK